MYHFVLFLNFNLWGLSFLPPKDRMLEVIESDRRRNSGRSDGVLEDQSSCEKLIWVWFDFRHSCKRKSTLLVNYIPYMDFMAKQVSSGLVFYKPKGVCVLDPEWRASIHRSVLDPTCWDCSWRTLSSGWGSCLVLVPRFSIVSLDRDSGPELVRLSSLSGIGLLSPSEPEWYQNQSHFQPPAFFLSCLCWEELQLQPCLQSWSCSTDTAQSSGSIYLQSGSRLNGQIQNSDFKLGVDLIFKKNQIGEIIMF